MSKDDHNDLRSNWDGGFAGSVAKTLEAGLDGQLIGRPGVCMITESGLVPVEASGPLAPKPGTDKYGNRLPQDPAFRKNLKVFEGCFDYFPDALAYVSLVSLEGAEKHCGGVLGWDRTKSTDHLNCAGRHLLDIRGRDPESPRKLRHLGMLVWRLLAELQITLEKAKANGESWV